MRAYRMHHIRCRRLHVIRHTFQSCLLFVMEQVAEGFAAITSCRCSRGQLIPEHTTREYLTWVP